MAAYVLKVTTCLPDADYIYMRAQQCRGQHWFFVLMVNPDAPSQAGEQLLKNLKMLHLDSGDACNFFLAGYVPFEMQRFEAIDRMMAALDFESGESPQSEPLSNDPADTSRFSPDAFVSICKEFERLTSRAWRYSGECELLMFELIEEEGKEPRLNEADFMAYNLDDILRNRRTVMEFLRVITIAAEDGADREETKRRIDEKYAELIMPTQQDMTSDFALRCMQQFGESGYASEPYYFLSYSTKDFKLVTELRKRLEAEGKRCWMAPFSIPQGTNYAYMIEKAIRDAERFVLILSRDAVNSVWVGKELKRAISRFQREQPDKLRVFWCNGAFPLADTPFAYPLEDVQIGGDLQGKADNYRMLLE